MEYYTTKKDKIVCNLCGHYCHIKEGGAGICGVNINKNGKLECTVYGRAAALHLDRIEKKPLYHFLPGSKTLSFGTVGCNFACPFCQNWQISQTSKTDEFPYISPEKLLILSKEQGSNTISFTYNEPAIFYPYAKAVSVLAKNEGMNIVYVTNGFFSKESREDLVPNSDALNIDLKSFNPKYYKNELKGRLETVLENIEFFISKGLWVEITTLLIEGVNDSKEELESMAAFFSEHFGRSTPWHINAFYPNYKLDTTNATSLQALLNAKNIAQNYGIEYVYIGNIAYPQDTVCPNCEKIVVKREKGVGSIINLEEGKCYHCGFEIKGIWS